LYISSSTIEREKRLVDIKSLYICSERERERERWYRNVRY
jgi:hypothetical protein